MNVALSETPIEAPSAAPTVLETPDAPTATAAARGIGGPTVAATVESSPAAAAAPTVSKAAAESSVESAPAPAAAQPENITAETLQARLRQVDEMSGVDDAAKAKLRELYLQAQRDLEAAAAWETKAASSKALVVSSQGDLQRVENDLKQLPAEFAAPSAPAATLPEVEATLSKCETKRQEQRALVDSLEEDRKNRAGRKVEITKRSAALSLELEKLDQDRPIDDGGPLSAARRAANLCRRRALTAEANSGERELAANDATAKLLPLRRDLAARRLDLAEQEGKYWQQVVNQLRHQEAERQLQQANRDAVQAHPAVQRIAKENAQLAEERKTLAASIAEATAQLNQTRQQLAALKDRFAHVCAMENAVGLTNTIGLQLRKERELLPDLSVHRRSLFQRQQTAREVELSLLEKGERRANLANLEAQATRILDALGPAPATAERERLHAEVIAALRAQREYLDTLLNDNNTYFDQLVELDSAEQQFIDEAETFERYIDERVLWIASDSTPKVADARHLPDAARWLAGPEALSALGGALAVDTTQRPGILLAALSGLVLLVVLRWRMREKLNELGQAVSRANCYRIAPTFEALAISALLAALGPAVMAFLGWRLAARVDAADLAKAVGEGLLITARVYFVMEIVRVVFQPNGLAEAHFECSTSVARLMRGHVGWLRFVVLPAAFVALALRAQEKTHWDSSLGRLGFVVAMLALSVFVQRVLRPSGGVFQAWLGTHRGHWLARMRYLWFPFAVGVPFSLAVLAIVGYYYTAQQLAVRLTLTFDLLLGFALIRALLLRWVQVSRRKLAIEHARQRRAAQAEPTSDEASAAAPVPEHDLATINQQTRRVIEYALATAALLGLWMAWVDVTPALGVLDQIPLWTTTVTRTITENSADGTTILRNIDAPSVITVASLIAALLTLGMTLIAAKNMPGLLEMVVLRHLPLDGGVRYAVVTVSRYMITIVGLTLACATLGIGWSKVQWLVAAISVGLGFGLQEIFANFVSGLIILFERPIRVGDVITVGEVTGSVSRIRMRATTITDWDRRELIVPNREFVTSRLLNWTLSDQVNRVVINVGLAYGSDTQLATALLHKIAREHPDILDDPEPRVTFEAFGASSLDFVLRFYLPNLERRLAVVHELHMAIDLAFREAGLEIAFPQQDVHLRSINVRPEALQGLLGGASAKVVGGKASRAA